MTNMVTSREAAARTAGVRRTLQRDMTPRSEVLNHIESSTQKRLFNPLTDVSATDRLADLRISWGEQPVTVALTSGVFDLMHLNHRAYLLNTKLAAVPHHYNRYYAERSKQTWDSLRSDEKKEFSLYSLATQEVRLIVSVDGNAAVAARKGNKPEKGGVPRPVYDWETRARDVLSASIEVEDESFVCIADVVTLHDNMEPTLLGSPHAGILEIGNWLNPDVWSVYFESQDIIDAVEDTHAEMFAGVDVRVLDGHDFYCDEQLGGPFSTTLITQRIGGAALSSTQVQA